MLLTLLLALTPADTLVWKGPPGSVTPSLAAGVQRRPDRDLARAPQARGPLRAALRDQRRQDLVGARHHSRVATSSSSTGPTSHPWSRPAKAPGSRTGPRRPPRMPYAYHVMVSTSRDRGRTWTAPRRLHDDTSATEHGFVAVNAGPVGHRPALARRAQHRGRIGRNDGADPVSLAPTARSAAKSSSTRAPANAARPRSPAAPTDSWRRGATGAKAKSATSPCRARRTAAGRSPASCRPIPGSIAPVR